VAKAAPPELPDSGIIHCRLSPEMLERVDAQVALARAEGVSNELASRSGVVRALLAQQLAADPNALMTREVLARMPWILQQVSRRALARTLEALPAIANQVAQEVTEELLRSDLGAPGRITRKRT
jgi:hypothetical protein